MIRPVDTGFGTFLIDRLLQKELDAFVEVFYKEGGLRCLIERIEPSSSG